MEKGETLQEISITIRKENLSPSATTVVNEKLP